MNDIVEFREQHVMTAAGVRQHVNLIQEVMKAVMKENTHYGTIPGCKQPSLYKAGSEVLLTTFRIAVDPEVEDLSGADDIRYRVKAKGVHQLTGTVVGIGVGECSSNEDKYKWRKAVNEDEWNNTPETRRRVKYANSQNGAYTVKQVRTEPSDVANTVLKMAKKRAQIDLTLTATGASDIFTQDIEDMPEELRPTDENDEPRGKPKTEAPKARTDSKGVATEKQIRLIQAKLEKAGLSAEMCCDEFKIDALVKIPFDQVNNVLAWIDRGH